MGPAYACAMRKRKEKKRQGTRNLADSVPFPHGHGGRPFIFLFMMIIFDLGKPWIFSFYMPYLTILYLPTYVRSPSFSEKQGRSDQVILFCLGTRPNSKGEILLLVHGTAETSGCYVARTFILCLSLSLSSDEQEKYLPPSICQITHTVDSTNHSTLIRAGRSRFFCKSSVVD